mgnify:CR=1 FL=1|tara:strand:- start:22141 stop:22791 length:651 start_codon:yes stop_codon:yes gene_type:complete
MKVDVDTKQRLMTALIFLTEFYKVLMGTFLGVFVPLKCKEEVCTITDNIYTDDYYHMITNIYNLISFIVVIGFYVIELRRENWSIEYLDIDETKALNHLDDEVENYPLIKANMKKLNIHYYRAIHLAIFMLVTNFGLSGVLVGFNYYSINTLNSILSFFMLVFMKLSKARGIASTSLKNEMVCSGFLTAPKVYNTIDVDHVNTGNSGDLELGKTAE